jgi:ankyrin repeat protein
VEIISDPYERRSAFLNAVLEGWDAVVRVLLQHGIPVDGTYGSEDGETALLVASSQGFDKVVNVLLECGANVHASHFIPEPTDSYVLKTTALHLAAKYQHLAVAEALLQHGADVNALAVRHLDKDPFALHGENVTPLGLATESGCSSMVQLLRKHGANPDAFLEIEGRE